MTSVPSDDFDLSRFIEAQAPIYDRVHEELARGRKTSHWMWFVFPQVAGLARSWTARYYALASLDEAKAYLAHPVLGARLRECTRIVNGLESKSLVQIFGTPDDLKFRSSMTLFALAAPGEPAFQAALDKYCDGERDALTVERVGS